MNKFVMTAAAACFAFSGAAHASPITISEFSVDAFSAATNYDGFVIQDFEDSSGFKMSATLGGDQVDLSLADGAGAGGMLLDPFLHTNVGSFTTNGGTGGATQGICTQSGASTIDGGVCDKLYLREDTDPSYGQESTVAVDSFNEVTPGDWSLNANDTLGIVWDVVKGEGGSLFNRVVFAMMDAADSGASVTVELGDGTITSNTLSSQANGNTKLIVIDFGMLVSDAKITIASSQLNDSISFDGASVGVVPLPAGGLLLLTGLGALALRRRRKAA